MEIWQTELLKNINVLDFKGNKIAIYKAFEKVCEPVVGYKGCKFYENKLEINNKIYTLIIDENRIMITYSDEWSQDDSWIYELKYDGYFVEEAYFNSNDRPGWHIIGDNGKAEIDYELILDKLMSKVILGD